MAEMNPKIAKIMTFAGAVSCQIAIVIMIFVFLGRSELPIVVPILLLITGVMIIVVSLSFHTKKINYMSQEKEQVEQIRKGFEQDFEKFAGLKDGISNLNLADAENLQRELGEFKVKHTGKKSEIAGAKKLIGASCAGRTRCVRTICADG